MTRRTIAFLALASTAALGGHLLAACGEDDGGGGVDAGAADVSLDTSLPKADGSAGSDAGTPVDASKTDSAATTDGGQDATVVVDASLDAGADAALDAATDAPPCVPLVLLDGGGVVPTPYLQASDSPFRCVPFTSYYHLDNLEDGGIKKPGLTALSGVSTLSSFSGSIIDSVDGDDGTLSDGGTTNSCPGCNSWFTGNSAAGIEFQFNEATLGALPTHAGLVWTDGSGNVTVTFSAFGADGGVLVSYATSGIGDGSNNSTSAEDRFFGAVHDAGIKRIKVTHTSGGLEVDHVQYGR